MQKCFPFTTDKMDPERAEFSGVKPLLLGALNGPDLIHLLGTSETGRGKVEMGAGQAIIVRTDAARERVKALLPVSVSTSFDVCMWLRVYQCMRCIAQVYH